MIRDASSASRRLYERFLNDPYRKRIRGLCSDGERSGWITTFDDTYYFYYSGSMLASVRELECQTK